MAKKTVKRTKLEYPELDNLISVHDAAQKELQRKGEKALKAAFKVFFAAHPEVESLKWTQYIPSFNDGDPCTFSLDEPRVKITGAKMVDAYENLAADEYYDEYDDGFVTAWDVGKKKNKPLERDLSDLYRKLEKMESVLEAVFGSNAEIVVTPKKITVDDYYCGF